MYGKRSLPEKQNYTEKEHLCLVRTAVKHGYKSSNPEDKLLAEVLKNYLKNRIDKAL